MTAAEPLGVPGLPPVRLLTAAEYAKLGETGWGYTELMEGRILVSPSPTAKHNMAGLALAMQLVPQLPDTGRYSIGCTGVVTEVPARPGREELSDYCDDEVVLRGRAARLEVTPDHAHGLVVRVVHGGLLRRRARCTTGRAVQLGCRPTGVWRDSSADHWTSYRHTEDWQLIRP